MADGTKIEWCDASWNPIRARDLGPVGTGPGAGFHCEILTPGCEHCYAQSINKRLGTHHPYLRTSRDKVHVFLDEKMLTLPLRWCLPRRIFVGSMTDLFGDWVADEMLDRIFAVMGLCPQHTFQILTKRAARMRVYCSDPNVTHRIAQAMDALSGAIALGPEEVRPISGFPGYLASSHGFIYSEKRGGRRKLKPDAGDQGRLRVQLHRDSKPNRRGERLLVHRLILETFVGPAPEPDVQGRHRDGNPGNNAAANLRWGDQGENWDDSKRHGTHRRYSKLTPGQAIEIRRRYEAGDTAAALGREFGISDTQARNIGSGKQWAVASPIEWPLPNCWKGVSVEDQRRAEERIPELLATPAAVRWISAEPLIGPADLTNIRGEWNSLDGGQDDGVAPAPTLDWVVVGGESGHGARPFYLGWARSLITQCEGANVPIFVKQLGASPYGSGFLDLRDRKGGNPEEWPVDLRVRKFPGP